MIEVCVHTASIEESHSGQITGILFLDVNGKKFPEENWSDLIIIVLNFWWNEFEKMNDSNSEGDFRFMDGPISFRLKRTGELGEFLGYFQEKMILKEKINVMGFYYSLRDITKKIISETEEMKLGSADIEILKTQLNKPMLNLI